MINAETQRTIEGLTVTKSSELMQEFKMMN